MFTAKQLDAFRDYEEVRKLGKFNMLDPNARRLTGLDKDGNPSWWEPQANATYGMTFAELFYENQNKDEK